MVVVSMTDGKKVGLMTVREEEKWWSSLASATEEAFGFGIRRMRKTWDFNFEPQNKEETTEILQSVNSIAFSITAQTYKMRLHTAPFPASLYSCVMNFWTFLIKIINKCDGKGCLLPRCAFCLKRFLGTQKSECHKNRLSIAYQQFDPWANEPVNLCRHGKIFRSRLYTTCTYPIHA